MCTYDAMVYVEELERNQQRYTVFNKRMPRKGPESPFDLQSENWKECEWAPAFDEDTDPVWHGHK